MELLELAQSHVAMRKVGSEWHGPCPRCGTSHADPRMSDRFSVKPNGMWFCRNCGHGDAVSFLREFEGKTCPEAHETLGKECTSSTCAVLEKCSRGRKDSGAPKAARPLRAPKPTEVSGFVPAAVVPPEERWRQSAEKLIDRAHAELLGCPGQLAYLAGRGLPLDAVVKYRLGWIPKDLFRPRASWGLPAESWPDGKAKMLKIHSGLLIPTFVDGQAHRLRIRRPKETLKEGEPGYLEIKGSGNDRIITNPSARAVVVVESDLDALLIDWVAGDLVGAMPTVSAEAKPKESTWKTLRRALCILVAMDYEPTWNEQKQCWVNVGGKASHWWNKQFPRAKRWPVPVGKDPGEYYQYHSGDLRAWILAGLPPVFHIAADLPASKKVEKPEVPVTRHPSPVTGLTGAYMRGTSKCGRAYFVAEHRADVAVLRAEFPEDIPFDHREITLLGGGKPEGAAALLCKSVFPDAEILGVRPIVGDGAPTIGTFDPSRQRVAQRKQRG